MTLHEENNTPEKILKDLKPPFKKSKDDIWNEVFEDLEEEKAEAKVIPITFIKYGVAASLTLFLGLTMFARFYTENISSPQGKHLSHILPDGSEVTMNAATQLSYHPYWWNFNREVMMEGEAFFEVEKGSQFSVISQKGATTVLGTSFNISTRNAGYTVDCKTGKVRVKNEQSEVILTPNLSAVLDQMSFQVVEHNNQTIHWMNNDFMFTSQRLGEVFEEVERQYNISIDYDRALAAKRYTGFFNRDQSIDSTLQLICESFALTFVKENDRYKVTPN